MFVFDKQKIETRSFLQNFVQTFVVCWTNSTACAKFYQYFILTLESHSIYGPRNDEFSR